MTRAAAIAAVTAGLALGGIWASGAFGDPGLPGTAPTVYRTVVETRTVDRRIAGHSSAYWHWRNGQHTRALNHANVGLRRARLRIRRETLDYRDDYGIRTTPLAQDFLCIHSHEGSWTDSGAPYWGGTQMDLTFMAEYAPGFYHRLGTADHWPAFVQLAVSMEAYYDGRGFSPWPNTSRMCGL